MNTISATLTAAHKLEKRMSEVYPDGAPRIVGILFPHGLAHFVLQPDPLCAASRSGTHTLMSMAIAIRDLGWMPGGGELRLQQWLAPARQQVLAPCPARRGFFGANPLGRKTARRRPNEEKFGSRPLSIPRYGPAATEKRAREVSPPPRDRDRESTRTGKRDRRDMPPPRRRYGSPDWGRGSPPQERRRRACEKTIGTGMGLGQDDRGGPGWGRPGVAAIGSWGNCLLRRLSTVSRLDFGTITYPLTQHGLGPVV